MTISDEDIPVYFNPDSNYLETVLYIYIYVCVCTQTPITTQLYVKSWRDGPWRQIFICQVITTLGIFSRELPAWSSGQSSTHFYLLFFCGVFGKSNLLLCSFPSAACNKAMDLHCDVIPFRLKLV